MKELKEVVTKFPAGTSPNDIPNITVRLFHTKFKSLLEHIEINQIFGEIIAYVYTLEFQKRDLPNAHLVVTLNPNNNILFPQMLDKYISAEIPSDDKELQKLVIKHMFHGPHTNQSPCLIKEQSLCKKKFPKQFRDTTILKKKKNGYPEYQRKDNSCDNHTYRTKGSQIIPVDNRMVVPYNRFLLKKYKCHINVKYCASIHSIKYMFDYIK